MAKNTLQRGNHKLKVTEECREAISAAKQDDPVTIDRAEKTLRFLDAGGRLLGTLTNKHPITKELDAGNSLLYCAVAWTYDVSDRYPFGLVSARVNTGDPEDTYVKWCLANNWGKPAEPRLPRDYLVNIVGESVYQAQIRTCEVGDRVLLHREPGNPHDPRAIVAKTMAGATIGYIPRSSWVQRFVHEEGRGLRTTIHAIHTGPPMGVVLSAAVTGDETPTIDT